MLQWIILNILADSVANCCRFQANERLDLCKTLMCIYVCAIMSLMTAQCIYSCP